MKRVTDLEKFSLEEIWRPFQTLFGDGGMEDTLNSPPFGLDETARLLGEDNEWAQNVLDRVRRIGFRFPPYIVHPLVDVVRQSGMQAEISRLKDERNALDSMPTNWELSCENEDTSDLSSDLVWVVYSVNGGLNDREWTKLGQGDTPSNAINAARIKQPNQH